ARRQLSSEPRAAEEEIGRDIDALRGAMEEMRQLVATLRTDTAPFDLPPWLRATAAEMAGSTEVDLQLPAEPLPLSGAQQYQLARVIQEALTNCLRHAQVTRAEVEVRVTTEPGGRGKRGSGP